MNGPAGRWKPHLQPACAGVAGGYSAFAGIVMAAVALVLAAAMAGGLAGCSSGGAAGSGGSSSAVAGVEEEAAEHEEVTVRLDAPAALEGPLGELQSAYASDKPWLSFEPAYYPDAGELNEALVPGTSGKPSSSSALSVPGASSSSSSSDSSAVARELPADIVFEESAAAMAVAEEGGAIDLSTRSDMLEDRLVLAVGDGSDISAASTAELQAGAFKMAVVSAADADGARQREVLSGLGLYADGAFAGGLAPASADAGSSGSTAASTDGAPAAGKVVEVRSTADQFEALAADPGLVGIVRAGDLYRYGGVKAVGDVPSELYPAMRYPMALAAGTGDAEGESQVRDVSLDFLRWMVTDEDALRIIEKWGLRLSA